MMMNIENFFLSKFCGGLFYPMFRKLLNEAEISTDHMQKEMSNSIG